ncbi:hypothetical protein SAMN04487895_109249 [Paenibacillus sophorae]|uniref:Uncharacterized protein n=1 Tax=Paenibacillus sophorae TaxID=1333845 RepID=A0A1H8RDT7_9BACL|nr:hypothetical protein [Paenibacillus sophorae]QWU15041.1 hypothetical protein KP014_24565 [Paenibacillus sophorae]SEO64183.1 hypothetical protein SAMN04487895_109249 [Paenibacillus sophorae]
MQTKMPFHKRKALYLFGFLLISDIVLFLLQKNGYYLIPLLKPPEFFVVLFNTIVCIIILILIRKIMFVVYLSLPLFIFIAFSHFWYASMEYHYRYLHSPKRTETLIVKYRVATLGESSYFFGFYQKSFLGLLMQKLNGQEYSDMISDYKAYKTPEEVLGLDYPKWINEKELIFNTLAGEKKIIMK